MHGLRFVPILRKQIQLFRMKILFVVITPLFLRQPPTNKRTTQEKKQWWWRSIKKCYRRHEGSTPVVLEPLSSSAHTPYLCTDPTTSYLSPMYQESVQQQFLRQIQSNNSRHWITRFSQLTAQQPSTTTLTHHQPHPIHQQIQQQQLRWQQLSEKVQAEKLLQHMPWRLSHCTSC